MSVDEEYPVWYEPKFFKRRPENLYEKFVESWMHFSGSGLKHSDIQQFANADWKTQSADEKHSLVRKHVRYIKSNKPKKSRSLFDCGFTKAPSKSRPSHLDTVTAAESERSTELENELNQPSMTTNASNDTNVECIQAGERSIIELFLAKLSVRCLELLKDPGAEKSQFLFSSLLAAAQSYLGISELLKKYTSNKKRSKNTKFSETLSSLYKKLDEIKDDIISALDIKTDASLGYHIMSKNADQKELLFKNVSVKCQALKSFLSVSKIRTSLARRVKQMSTSRSDLSPGKILCYNDTSLTWHEAFANLISDMNAYDMNVYNIGMLMKDSAAVEVKLLLSQVRNVRKDFLKQILMTFPLLLLMKTTGEMFVINFHQISNNCSEIDALMETKDKKQVDENSCTAVTKKKTPTVTVKPGAKPVEEKFPNIAEVATEFIKRNGFKAAEKRRDDDIISCGVSVEEVREHLLQNIPGLAEHGLSKTTVRYLFKPVNKCRNTSKHYKEVVKCRVPSKDNSGRGSDENSHYLHSLPSLTREYASGTCFHA